MFEEQSASARVASLPLAHLSIELGHLYIEDFKQGPDRLREMFRQVSPWARTAGEVCTAAATPRRARISTCFLIDDYFSSFSSPREVVPTLLAAATAADLRIDYIARESACAQAREVPVAELVAARLVSDPPPGSDGRRPPAHEAGWLCNGVRSPLTPLSEAMRPELAWAAPSENAANRHSIFVDVEIWDERAGTRRWSCPFLAAVWQLLRLGMLRMLGQPVVHPQLHVDELPDEWSGLPPVLQVQPAAAPFAAYRTFSVLSRRFLPIEHAVRTILSQVAVQEGVAREVELRAVGEGIRLPAELVDRIDYVFAGGAS